MERIHPDSFTSRARGKNKLQVSMTPMTVTTVALILLFSPMFIMVSYEFLTTNWSRRKKVQDWFINTSARFMGTVSILTMATLQLHSGVTLKDISGENPS